MFSSFIRSYKSRSLIYRPMLARLRELANQKVLNHKYEDKTLQFKLIYEKTTTFNES